MTNTTTRPTTWPTPATGPPARTGTGMRPMTGIILGWNTLMAAWIVYALVVTAHQSSTCASQLYADACQTGTGVGGAIAIGGILFLTAIIDVILAVIWMVTKKD